jgi:streptomycin 6-kinase
MVRERLIEYHVLRIKQGNKAARLDSIEQLILLEAVEALDSLRLVVEQDEDVDVRRAAQQAGRHLFRLSLEKRSDRG